MTIEIPDYLLEPMREMPVISNSGKYKMKNADAIAWIGQADELYIPDLIVRRTILRRAEQLGIIRHNPDTDTWQGVDCDGT